MNTALTQSLFVVQLNGLLPFSDHKGLWFILIYYRGYRFAHAIFYLKTRFSL